MYHYPYHQTGQCLSPSLPCVHVHKVGTFLADYCSINNQKTSLNLSGLMHTLRQRIQEQLQGNTKYLGPGYSQFRSQVCLLTRNHMESIKNVLAHFYVPCCKVPLLCDLVQEWHYLQHQSAFEAEIKDNRTTYIKMKIFKLS